MSIILRVCDADGCREFGESDFPLALGVSSEGLPVFGSDVETGPAARFGHSNCKMFLQADDGFISVQLNGQELNGS